MNLTKRLGGKHRLWCPFSEAGQCAHLDSLDEKVRKPGDCAHYNPDTDECIHVEAARAQAAIATSLEAIVERLYVMAMHSHKE